MYSMTGFGKAELRTSRGQYSIEISSVNNRFLELSPKLPRAFFGFEARIRDLVGKSIQRGKVYFYVGYDEPENSTGQYAINKRAARAYYQSIKAAQKELKIPGDFDIRDLLLLPDIASQDKPKIEEDDVWNDLKKVSEKAIKELLSMRKKEGGALAKEMRGRLKVIEVTIKHIDAHSGDCVDAYRERLTKRVEEYARNGSVDQKRLEEEIVIVAERTDITEECTRLSSHISQFSKALSSKESVGKKLNFILQEMNREANTIASKCSDLRISSDVISLKEEIEKLREQVQNVE